MAIMHVTLATRDVERTRSFFSETFEWRTLQRPQTPGTRGAWLGIGGGQEVHVVELPDYEPSALESEFGRHIAIGFPRSGFSALRERLARNGAVLMAAQTPTPFERFFFRDPNGYCF